MKTVFTTGEAAEICKVSQQTIIRCFDSGRLKGFRVPGSRFRRIPREALIAFMKDNGIPPDSLESGKKKVLVVDDDPEIVELFVDVLERDGRFEVKTASTGYDAGMITQEFGPDLIILDYMLPDINGNIVCQTIRQKQEFEHTKIVIVSGVVNQDEINDLLKSGADEFVKKPFNIEKLIERIRGTFNGLTWRSEGAPQHPLQPLCGLASVMPDQLREKRVELILQQLEELPTLPAVAVRVLEATVDDASSVQQISDLISSDQSLTTRLMQLLHKADVGASSQIKTVDRAVLMLGFDAVRSMVLAVSVFQAMGAKSKRKSAHFDRDEFWKHSVATACCAELLAGRMGAEAREHGITPSEAFVCGLLHDLGKVALDAALPKSFDRVVEAADMLRSNIADLERSIIGLDHMVVGKRLAERWGLPSTLRECIWLHGQLPSALPATVKAPKLVCLITLADILVREQHLGYSGNYAFTITKATLLDTLGLTQAVIDDVLQQLVSHIEPRAKGLGLDRADTDDLYLHALTQANRELGRMTEQLAAKNKRLGVRAKFFDALSQFQSELRADAAPQMVLEAIGQTAVTVLDVSSAAVFSAIPGQGFAETLLFDHQGDVFQHSVIDCPKPPATVTGGDGPLMAAGPELEWLLSNISPRLAADQRYWVGLEADGVCIGGVVWGSKVGEAQRLAPQVNELSALAVGWGLALRTAQIREESRTLSEQLADANRRLQSAQEEIQRSKTIITVGEMAAGAAHEMNNPLAVISGRSQLLASQLTDPKQKHAASLIHEQSHRLSEIITELMDFAKPVPPHPTEIELAELVDRALHEAKSLTDPADRSIEVTIADVPPVIVDEKQVTAALIEVISNAIQATDEAKGHVTLHAAYDAHGGRVVISVNDNGCGMDEETLKRAFDPFFSSKPAGRRRGMGLAKALRWIEASGGSIHLESRVDKGTRSVILLPAAQIDMGFLPEMRQAAEG